MTLNHFLVGMCVAILATPVIAGESPSDENASVFFIALEDGATVSSPLTVYFGLDGMGVAPAGIEADYTGHHHLLVNAEAFGPGNLDVFDDGIPADDNHLHFGAGQTQTTLDLPAGTHTLQLVLGDHFHVPHAHPIYSEQITITVE